MKIRYVKPDDDDYCLSVPLSILPGLNADNVSAKSAAFGNKCKGNCVNAQQAVYANAC